MTSADDARSRTVQAVTELVAGSGLHLDERANELVLSNPAAPERGQVHVAYDDGYVSCERVIWTYLGTLEGLPRTGEQVISGQTILDTLLAPE
jgi:hypothetical protein